MIFKFACPEDLKNVTEFAKMVNNIYDHSAVETIDRVAHKLEQSDGTIELSEDTHDNNDYNELVYLFNIVKILNDISAEHVNSADNVYRVLKDYVSPSDVPRFLAMIEENNIDPGWCDYMFEHWASEEGMGQLAIDCMDIQLKHHVSMTGVYDWLNNNDPTPGTDWTVEAKKYRKEVFGA
jgi:hypothetical protein